MIRFRTELIPEPSAHTIDGNTPLLFLGSCFADEIGSRLADSEFDISINPFGPLYNPLSIANCLERALLSKPYSMADLTPGPRGYHCLDYATRFSGADAQAIIDEINGLLANMAQRVTSGAYVFITLGTAFVYRLSANRRVVGNCHKFPASTFCRSLISVDETSEALNRIVSLLRTNGAQHIVFTVSPIRHLADGFHNNTLSKSTLHLAVANLSDDTEYFPSYELVVDDLRDYRAYADDLVHISKKAVDYIYEKFEEVYMTPHTRAQAAIARKKAKAANHISILSND